MSRMERRENSWYSDQDTGWAVRGSNPSRRDFSLLQNVQIIVGTGVHSRAEGDRSAKLATCIYLLQLATCIYLLYQV